MRGAISFHTVILGVLRQRFWFAVHNAVAHPLMVVLPSEYGTKLHDWTAERMEEEAPAPPTPASAQAAAKLTESLTPEALAFLGRHRGPITVEVLRRAAAISNRELN